MCVRCKCPMYSLNHFDTFCRLRMRGMNRRSRCRFHRRRVCRWCRHRALARGQCNVLILYRRRARLCSRRSFCKSVAGCRRISMFLCRIASRRCNRCRRSRVVAMGRCTISWRYRRLRLRCSRRRCGIAHRRSCDM